MIARLKEISAADVTDLERWFAASEWPFHREQRVSAEWVRSKAAAGMFYGAGTRSFWYVGGDGVRVGIVRVFELEDMTPLLDLRIASELRRRGIGTAMLEAVTSLVFDQHRDVDRLGGYTRHDNAAMCRVFAKCGYELEARHRRAWDVEGGTAVDALGYAILREDWERETGQASRPGARDA